MTSRLSMAATPRWIAPMLFVGLSFFAATARAQVTPDVEMTIGDGQGNPGTGGHIVTISMDNPVEPVRALSIKIAPTPGGYLTLSNLLETGRTPAYAINMINVQPDGSFLLLLLDMSDTTAIPVGSGPILTFKVAVKAGAPQGSAIILDCTEVQAAGLGTDNELLAEFTDGAFYINDILAPNLTCPADMTVEATSAGGATVNFAPTVSDNVDPDPTVVCVPASGSAFPLGQTTVTCTATDDAGNSAQCTFTVTVRDTTAPDITCPANMTLEATGPNGAVATFAPTASDIVDASPTVVCVPPSGSTFPLGQTTVTCTATDDAGNSAQCTFTVTVRDTTAPDITCPANMTLEATGPNGAVATFAPTASDIVDASLAVVCVPPSGSTFPLGQTTVTCTATDDAGNSAQCTFTVTVRDTTAPDITCHSNMTLEATGPGGAVATFAPTASDIVDATPTIVCVPPSGSAFPLGQTTVTCTATDDAGNSAQCTFTVTVRDTTAPDITCPSNMTVEATGASGATVNFAPTASDIVDASLTIVCVPPSGSTFPLGQTTVTCTATDDAGNSSQCTFTVTVRDTTAPDITCPANMTLEATGPNGAVATFAPTASDIVDATLSVVCVPPSGSAFPLGQTTVTCTATDDAGNSAQCQFTVTVRDTTAPDITCPSNMTLEATGPGGAVATFAPTVSDVVDATPTIVCVPPSGSAFPLGQTTVTCTATDDAGNSAQCTFTVTVRDTTAPDITCPANMTLEATGPDGAVATFAPTVSDVVDATPTVVSVPPSGSTFPLGTTTVTCTATDDAGNSAQCTFKVTVEDTTAPDITCPDDITVEATGAAGAIVNFSVAATDAVDSGPTGHQIAYDTGQLSTSYSTGWGWGYANRFTNTYGRDVTVTGITMRGTPSAGAVDAYIWADNGGQPGAVLAQSLAQFLNNGWVTINFSGSGVTIPAGANVFAGFHPRTTAQVPYDPASPGVGRSWWKQSSTGAWALGGPQSTTRNLMVRLEVEEEIPSPSVVCDPASGSAFPLGQTTVTCTATDDAGNSSQCTFTVTVRDTTAPDITCPSNMTVEATGASGATVNFAPTASDIVDATPTVVCVPPSGSAFPLGQTTVTCTATDDAGNSAQCTFTVTVRDTTAPDITCPANMTLEATGPNGAVATFAPTASDIVDASPTVVCVPPSGSTFPLGQTTVTCTATDDAGNSAQCQFTVTVQDTTAPDITCPDDIKFMAGGGHTGETVDFTVTATDAVDPHPTILRTPASGSAFPLGDTVVTCTATDAAGNVAQCTFDVTLILFADFDEDCAVDLFDLLKLMGHYNSSLGDARYDPLYDLNDDDTINLFDLVLAANHFGSSCAFVFGLDAADGSAKASAKQDAPPAVRLSPIASAQTLNAGDTLDLVVRIKGGDTAIAGVQAALRMDPRVFEEIGWEELDYLQQDGSGTLNVPAPAQEAGQSTTVGVIRFPVSAAKGEGAVLKFALRVKDTAPTGQTAIALTDVLVAAPDAAAVAATTDEAILSVTGRNSAHGWTLYR